MHGQGLSNLLFSFAAKCQLTVEHFKCLFWFQTKHHYNTALVERLIHIISVGCQPGIYYIVLKYLQVRCGAYCAKFVSSDKGDAKTGICHQLYES